MVIISIGLVASGYDLLPVDFENLPLEINDEPWRPRDLAWTYRDSFSGYYDRTPTAGYRLNTYLRANIDLYYDGEGENVFTKENFKKIQAIENELTSLPKYRNEYCQLDPNGDCEKPMSIIRYFDGTYAHINPIFNDSNFDNIVAVLDEASTNTDTKGALQFFLGKSSSITSTGAYSSITRSIMPMGYPLENVASDDDYEQIMKDWQVADLKPILVRTREECSQFDFSYRSDMLWIQDVLDQAMKDVMCAIGSICFIFVLILIHTRSLWITGFAILSIITSFVCTNLIYRVVLDFRYIGFFHVLTLFIVLGIGADDIFVFYDVWRNTAYDSYPSLAHRLSDAYRKSVFSMLFTSITTSTAFFASAISPLLATRSFGVFSGIVIIVNYLSVILYFPTVVIMYHTKFEKFKWPCIQCCIRRCKCCKKRSRDDSCEDPKTDNHTDGRVFQLVTPISVYDADALSELDEERNTFGTQLGSPSKKGARISANGLANGVNKGQTNEAFKAESDSAAYMEEKQPLPDKPDSNRPPRVKARKEKSVVVLFFRDKYSWFVTHKVFRWIILAVMLAVLVAFIVQASKLEPDNEGVSVLVVFSIQRKLVLCM